MNAYDHHEYVHRQTLAGGNVQNWHNLTTESNYEGWPITLKILNDEDANTVTVRFISSNVDVECEYNDSFDIGSDLVVGWNPDASWAANITKEVVFSSISIAR